MSLGTEHSFGSKCDIAVFRCLMDGQFAAFGELLNALPAGESGGILIQIDNDTGTPVVVVMVEAQKRPGVIFYQSAIHMQAVNLEARAALEQVEQVQTELTELAAKKKARRR